MGNLFGKQFQEVCIAERQTGRNGLHWKEWEVITVVWRQSPCWTTEQLEVIGTLGAC